MSYRIDVCVPTTSGASKVWSKTYLVTKKTHILKRVIGDFILLKNDEWFQLNDKWMDFITSSSQDMFWMWMLSNPNSKWLLRQIPAAWVNFSRFTSQLSLATLDVFASKGCHAVLPSVGLFDENRAEKRLLTRLFTTCRLNGGMYVDLGSIISSFAHLKDPSLYTASFLNSYIPKINRIEANNSFLNSHKLEKLFKSETGRSIDAVFRDVAQIADIEPNGSIITHSATLADGTPATISYITPHVQRMRKLDLFPFRIVNFAMSLLPFAKPEHALLSSLIDRLDYTLPKEVAARRTILLAHGLDISETSSNPATLLNKNLRAERSSPLFIPAPLLPLCSEHIMVSVGAPPESPAYPNPNQPQLASFLSKITGAFAFLTPTRTGHHADHNNNRHNDHSNDHSNDHGDDQEEVGFGIPLAGAQVCEYGKKVGLWRYGPVTQIPQKLMEDTLKYGMSVVLEKRDAFENGRAIGVSQEATQQALEEKYRPMFREYMREHAKEVLATGECVSELAKASQLGSFRIPKSIKQFGKSFGFSRNIFWKNKGGINFTHIYSNFN